MNRLSLGALTLVLVCCAPVAATPYGAAAHIPSSLVVDEIVDSGIRNSGIEVPAGGDPRPLEAWQRFRSHHR